MYAKTNMSHLTIFTISNVNYNCKTGSKVFLPHQQNFTVSNGMGPMLLSNGVLSFGRRHPFLDLVLTEQAKNFKPHQWGSIGPTTVTACAKAYCDLPPKGVLEGNWCNPKSNIAGAGFKVSFCRVL